MYATYSPSQSSATSPHVDSGWDNPESVYPNFDITSNPYLRVRGGIGQIQLVWGTTPVGSDQFSEGTFAGLSGNPGSGSKCGLVIRATDLNGLPLGSGGFNAGYFVQRNFDVDQFGSAINSRWELYRVTHTSSTFSTDLLAVVLGEIVGPSDVLRLQSIGNIITVLRNGIVIMTGIEAGQSGFTMAAGGKVGFYDTTGRGGVNVDTSYFTFWRGGDIPHTWAYQTTDALRLSEAPAAGPGRSFSVKSGWAFPPAIVGNPVNKAFIGLPTEDETLS